MRKGEPTTTTVLEAEPGYRELHIEIDGWENWNDLLRYVIKPLSDHGFVPSVRVTVKAASVKGIPAKLIREQMEVSLQQLGIVYSLRTSPDAAIESDQQP